MLPSSLSWMTGNRLRSKSLLFCGSLQRAAVFAFVHDTTQDGSGVVEVQIYIAVK